MSTIDETHAEQSTEFKMPAIFPRLAYRDEGAALEYLVRVFQLEEISEARFDMGNGSFLAWLRTPSLPTGAAWPPSAAPADGVVMIGREDPTTHRIVSPSGVGQTSVQMMLSIYDIDAHFANAVDQGADVTMPLNDAFYGERRYEATDLEGHRWHFGESFDSVRARGGAVSIDVHE